MKQQLFRGCALFLALGVVTPAKGQAHLRLETRAHTATPTRTATPARTATPTRTATPASTATSLRTQELVRTADLSKLSPSDFNDDELDLPYYLAHFARVANSVALTGPRRGFIDIAVWRDLKDNQPYNARIMESILSLAYFYTLNRPWNIYRADPALRARLEAALDFWTKSQNPDGLFSEYAVGQWSLAPTAFATKFMGESLRLLKNGPPIDTDIYRRAVMADRKALMATLTRADMQAHGRVYTNQFSNAFAGAFAYLDLFPDTELNKVLHEQVKSADTDHQSPVGFFYELGGPDWGYDLNTHHSNFIMAWNYTHGTPFAKSFSAPMVRWYDWFAYNALPEPNNSRSLTLNRAIETRQRTALATDAGTSEAITGFPIAEVVPGARVLGPTREELARRNAAARAKLVKNWPRVDTMPVGTFRAFSPYAFLHRSHARWFPTETQWKAARADMRPVKEQRFTHQRVDSRKPMAFTFVRRPEYYAAFATGDIVTAQQRFGLGMLWTPSGGTLLQSQSNGTNTSWGTRASDTSIVYEAASIPATFDVNAKQVSLQTGAHDLPAGDLRIQYALGKAGNKTVQFDDAGVHVTVEHPNAFVEQLPLLILQTDPVVSTPGRVTLHRNNTQLVIRWNSKTSATVTRTDEHVGDRTVVVVSIPATGALHYDIQFKN